MGSGVLKKHAEDFRQRLHDRRFWLVQALVAFVTLFHAAMEASDALENLGAIYFVPASLYFVPVIYASLNFGRAGAIPTAIWSGLLAVPNLLIWHAGLEAVGEGAQVGIMIVVASMVAVRVDRETEARRRAESEEAARRVSEAKYHRLFESAGEAILVLDADGIVEEANTAAAVLFERPASTLQGSNVADLFDAEAARKLLRQARGEEPPGGELLVGTGKGPRVWVEPVFSTFADMSDRRVTQALLRDVTRRRERERGLESYAGQMLRAQEEERLRIAREIHDGTLPNLVLLCRRLDALEEGTDMALAPGAKQAVAAARDLAETVSDGLRSFSRDLRPSVLDDLGLAAATRRLVKELELRAAVEGRLEIEGRERRAHPDVELCLFRIAQEALRNVERHAHASKLVVTLSYEDRGLRLAVVDDGRGFDLPEDAASSPERFGLVGMKERALMLGGEFQITSTPGRGSEVEVFVPAHLGTTAVDGGLNP